MKQNINHNWNSNLAYAIGLIATDGNLSKDKRHILFTTTDLQLANTFKKCLNIKNKIIITSPSGFGKKRAYRINFGNVKLYQWLQTIGLMPKKTMLMGKLDIPDKYFVDFLRGHLDGDGSIFTYTDKYMKYKEKKYTYFRLYTKFISASFIQISWIREKIKEILNIQGSLTHYLKINRKFPIWQLRFAKNDSLKLLSWLYYKPNLPCLNRKRKIALRFIK
ncbi:MAG: LAGLIDADG family homing endonuclease [Candidatus Omnitrophota bacterium]